MVVLTISHCVEGLRGGYVVDGVLSELEANIREDEVLVCRSEISEDPGYGRGVPFWALNFSG